MRVLVLLLVAVAITAAYANSFLKNEQYTTVQERKQAMDEAIEEAKSAMEARELARKNRVVTQNKKDAKQLFRLFKKPSERSRKMARANRLYRDIVNKAERKMFEVKRAKVAKTEGAKARAESLAELLFHRPGSMLTSQEVARTWQVVQDLFLFDNRAPTCRFPTRNLYRTADGTCNNLRNPLFGASGIPLRRLVPAFYENGVDSLRGTLQAQETLLAISPLAPPNPSPRLISQTVISDREQDELPFTHLIMQFGQFLDHDLDLSPEEEEECDGCMFSHVCQPIKVAGLDPTFGSNTPNAGECLPFRRSSPVFEIGSSEEVKPLEQTNEVTSYIDGSMVYGSDSEKSKVLRSFEGGLLSEGVDSDTQRKPTLPIDERGGQVACVSTAMCFLCGDVRCNEQVSLTIMHTLWLREHNRCAREMTQINPHWNDEKLYQECRKIVIALIQKITYEDYLPKIMGSSFDRFIGDYKGYNSSVDATIPNSFSTAAYRYGHSLIRPTFDRLGNGYRPLPMGPLDLVDAFFSPEQFEASLGTDPIMRGWVSVNSRRMDEFMNIVLTTKLFEVPGTVGMDLASLNLQRGRDHGLPPYIIYRDFCSKIFGISSGIENTLTLVRFLQLYGSLDTVDLWIAGLAEERTTNGLLGATFGCIFGLTFQAVRDGDRFFWLRRNEFTEHQRHSIRSDSFSRVICDNSDGITTIQRDAFVDTVRRHPLFPPPRVPCSKLDRIDLKLFEEAPCHFHAIMSPSATVGSIRVFSRSTQSKFDFTEVEITASEEPSPVCIPVQCPTPNVGTIFYLYSTVPLVNTVINSNPGLPADLNPNPGLYVAILPIAIFDGPTGLFTGNNNCNDLTGPPAFVLRINQEPTRVTTNEEESSVPKEILDELDGEDPEGTGIDSIEEKNVPNIDNTEMKKQKEIKKTASLFSELEEALKNLN